MRGVGGALVHHLGGAGGERTVGHVGVAGDPADVRGAPEHVGLRLDVEHRAHGERVLREVPAGGVEDALGLAGGAGGVEDEERVLGVEGFVLVGVGLRGERLGPVEVALGVEGDVLAGALDDEHLLHRGVPAGERLVHGGLESRGLAAPVAAVGGDDDLGLDIEDAGAQGVGGEPAEHHGVGGAEARAGEHRDHGLRDHREVDRDPVALHHTERCERVRRAADLALEVGVGDRAGVARLALEVDGDAVAVAGLDVAVDAVVGDVELPADEPAGERGVGPVEGVGEVGVPGDELAGLLGPESQAVRGGLVVEGGGGVGLRCELRARLERLFLAVLPVL